MKYFSILIYLFLITASLHAEINEYINDVYFANGINTNQQDAWKTGTDLKILYKLQNLDSYRLVKDWKVSVNHTEGVALDLVEAASQSIAIVSLPNNTTT